MTELDKQMYEKLIGDERQKAQPIWQSTALLLDLILKAFPLGFLLFSGLFYTIFSRTIIDELIVIFVVIDFWFTKNIIGRKLIGLRWFFGQDEYGVEKLMFQCRANDQYVSGISGKIFWGIQIFYVFLPVIFLITIIIVSPVLYQVDWNRALILVIIFAGGISNVFFFWQAGSGAEERQFKLKERLGGDMVQRLGTASIISWK